MASGTAKYRYQTNKLNIFYCVCDDSPALDVIRGKEPSANTTESITFKASKTSREFGFKPRTCILKLKGAQTTEGCLINPNAAVKYVPILTPDHELPARGSSVTVNGRVWIVSSISAERSV